MKKQRVICAMSGGVDSSVAAALLKKHGYDVIGIFMKLWSPFAKATGDKSENICCSADAETAARAVANKFKIPFYVVNFADEFKKLVVDYFIEEYEAGRTPNPCVICNRDIKGEVLMQKVLEWEGDYLATGHYAQIKQVRSTKYEEGRKYKLLQSEDETKDQTYFLWTLTQEKLAKLLFPVGHLTKSEVRSIAKKMNLPTAERRESQGICFIPDGDVAGFLKRYAKKLTKSGPIVDLSGKILGQHQGLINYTIGQREHLGLGGPRAYFVVELNSKENSLVVGEDRDLYRKTLIATDLNWIQPEIVKLLNGCIVRSDSKQVKNLTIQQFSIKATIRYGHPATGCKLSLIGHDRVKVCFKEAQRAITPGQSIVFYLPAGEAGNQEEVLGGGIINS